MPAQASEKQKKKLLGAAFTPSISAMQNFRNSIEARYLDAYGLVTVVPGADVNSVGMGNGLLHLGLYVVELAALGLLESKTQMRFHRTVDDCRVVEGTVTVPGLLVRHPLKSRDPESWDDYVGVAAASFFCGRRHANEIVAYGEANEWVFDNLHPWATRAQSPGKWFDRMPGFTAFLRMAAGRTVGFWDRFPLFVRILHATLAKTDKADTQMKSFLMLMVAQAEHPEFSLLFSFWEWRMRKRFGAVGKAFHAYFAGGSSETHPLVSALS